MSELFSTTRQYEEADLDFISSYFTKEFNPSVLNKSAKELFDLSFDAFDNITHAWMSELPVETQIEAFSKKVIEASHNGSTKEERRRLAEEAASDRGDENVREVLYASSKVHQEIHAMMGLLRFSPDSEGIFTALCEPDCLVLPALGTYFCSRFHKTPWAIIDEKRGIILSKKQGEKLILAIHQITETSATNGDEWEALWKHYHKTINNESRNNPKLQRQFMPKRYWKYLPEL